MSEPVSSSEKPAAPEQLYCGNCGTLIPPGKHFCPRCLAPASLAVPEPPVLDNVAAAPAPPAAPAVELAPAAPPPGPEPARPAVPPIPAPVSPVVPVVPPAPASAAPVQWSWLALMVGGLLLALPLLAFGCIALLLARDITFSGDITPQGFTLFTVLCCLVPGLICGGATIVAGLRLLRRPGPK